MDEDLNSLLDMDAGEVKDAPQLPQGYYIGNIEDTEQGESTQKGTPYYRFTFGSIRPDQEVEEDEWEEYTSQCEARGDVPSAFRDFYVTPKALSMLTKFLKCTGLQIEGKKIRELIPQSVGNEVRFQIVHEPSQREGDDRVFAKVGGTYPVE